jgi:hypothetical protein
MMRENWYCKFCLRETQVEHDGRRGHCTACRNPVVKRQCSDDVFHVAWFPLAEAIVDKECAICGAALKVAEKIEESPTAPDWLKQATGITAMSILVYVGIRVLDDLLGD